MRNRLNPADPDYQIKALLRDNSELRAQLTRFEADTHAASGGGGADLGYWVSLDLINPHIIVHHFDTDPGTLAIPVPISTLMVPDPGNPHVMTFPTL